MVKPINPELFEEWHRDGREREADHGDERADPWAWNVDGREEHTYDDVGKNRDDRQARPARLP